MTPWRDEIEQALAAFLTVTDLAGDPISKAEIVVEFLPAPHRPPSQLPSGKMAVYAFWGDRMWLKIGKAGPNSGARYASQHYNPGSARSTLAGSLVNDARMVLIPGLDPQTPGAWIKSSTHRVNILLPSNRQKTLLSLLEAFLHVRLKPRYEG